MFSGQRLEGEVEPTDVLMSCFGERGACLTFKPCTETVATTWRQPTTQLGAPLTDLKTRERSRPRKKSTSQVKVGRWSRSTWSLTSAQPCKGNDKQRSFPQRAAAAENKRRSLIFPKLRRGGVSTQRAGMFHPDGVRHKLTSKINCLGAASSAGVPTGREEKSQTKTETKLSKLVCGPIFT